MAAEQSSDATIWLGARTLGVPKVGGHFWVYLNWALGLRAQGCRVVWLEAAPAKAAAEKLASDLRARLAAYGLADAVALWQADAARPTPEGCVDLEEAGGDRPPEHRHEHLLLDGLPEELLELRHARPRGQHPGIQLVHRPGPRLLAPGSCHRSR